MPKTKAPELVRFGENARKRREEREWMQEQLVEMILIVRGMIVGGLLASVNASERRRQYP